MHAYTLFTYRYKNVYAYIEQRARLSFIVDDADAFPGKYILHLLYIIHVFTLFIYMYAYVYIEQEARLSPFVDDADAFPGLCILHSLSMTYVCA